MKVDSATGLTALDQFGEAVRILEGRAHLGLGVGETLARVVAGGRETRMERPACAGGIQSGKSSKAGTRGAESENGERTCAPPWRGPAKPLQTLIPQNDG